MSSEVPPKLPLNPSFYNLRGDELAFFKTQTGIHEDEELRAHILNVQAEAYAIYPYPCIRRLAFTMMKISRHTAYDAVLKIGREKSDAILLDLGCCFGNDTRKVIADGYPLKNVIASDIRPEFWALGHKLFRSSQESFPVAFIAGDIFDPKFLAPGISPESSLSSPPYPAPLLTSVTSLTQLQHRVSVIHASAFFHIFSEAQQHDVARLLGSLLSPLSGSTIFGSHVGAEGSSREMLSASGIGVFAHSPSSWEKLWVGEGGVFGPEDVKLSTSIVEVDRKAITQGVGNSVPNAHFLVWSVTRA